MLWILPVPVRFTELKNMVLRVDIAQVIVFVSILRLKHTP
jgi:hypothetical protein